MGANASMAAGIAADTMVPAGERKVYRYPSCKYLTLVRSVIGCLVALGCWSTGFSSIFDINPFIGIYFLVIAFPTTLLELGYIINLLGKCEGGCCCQMWGVLQWFGSWKRGVLYMIFMVLVWVIGGAVGKHPFFGMITAIGMLVLAVLYLSEPFQYMKQHLYAADTNAPQPAAPAGVIVDAAQPTTLNPSTQPGLLP